MKQGDRVRVCIEDREKWAFGVADRVNGMVGTVAKINEKPYREALGVGRYLVKFDKPRPNVTQYWPDYTNLWVDEQDLITIRG